MEDITAFFICDRKKCDPCNPQCTHTKDISHAVNVEGKFRKVVDKNDKTKVSMWQTALPGNSKEIKIF